MDSDGLQRLGLSLRTIDGRLSLVGADMTLYGDFSRLLPRVREDKIVHEMLVRAVRIKGRSNLRVVDATAGLGEDSFVLAAAGFEVCLFERDKVIAALLQDALSRAENDRRTVEAASRMHLNCEDGITGLASLSPAPDVVLLDPMFPARAKSASSKKKLQMLQMLERPCEDETLLFEAAQQAGPRKIVVKRPVKGPCLASRKPNYTLLGKTIRYDCYVFVR